MTFTTTDITSLPLAASTSDLLARITAGEISPSELAQRLGCTLEDVARWAATPGNLSLLEAVARLQDLQAHMLITRFRASAAVKLINTATTGSGAAAQKACMDLLRLKMDVFDMPRLPQAPQSARAAPSEEAIRAAFERVADEALDELAESDVDAAPVVKSTQRQ